MTEKRNWKYEQGQVSLCDLPIAAGLWSLNGAAWDGNVGWWYPGPDRAAWQALLTSRPDLKLLAVNFIGSAVEKVETTLTQDWIDYSAEGKGRHYHAGETVQQPRVFFRFDCGYSESAGMSRVSRRWTEAEAVEWLHRWHRQGNAFLVVPNVYNDRINKLRNVMRDRHGMTPHRAMPSPR